MKTLTPDIDLDHEVKALADFIALKWTPISGTHELFRAIRDAALHDARGWIDSYRVSDHLDKLKEMRVTVLKAQLGEEAGPRAQSYDAPSFFLDQADRLFHQMREEGFSIDGPWNYSQRVTCLTAALCARFEGLAQARPHGWADLHEGYQEFDGMGEGSPAVDYADFFGTKIEGTVSPDFVVRTALPYVMYDEVCQGHKAAEVLVGAVYAQFLSISHQLHAFEVCKEMDKLEGLLAPRMVFETGLYSENPFVKIVVSLMDAPYAEETYLESEAHYRAYQALSPEEKAAQEALHEAEVEEMVHQLLESPDGDEATLKVRAQMRKVFQA